MTPIYATTSAAAPALQYRQIEAEPVRAEPAALPQHPKPITYQPSLFTSRELPRVVPFESIAPESVEAPPIRAMHANPRPRRRKVIPGQQSLEFAPVAGSARYARPSEGVIYCDAPVALLARRSIAAALDASVVLIGLGFFGGVFFALGGQVTLNAKTIPMFLGVVATLLIFYRLLCCLGRGDTPGMQWTHLRLVNFDGQKPNRKQRFFRLGSGILSLFAAGLGLLWALVDEETLTWHDHISKTFPTPY
ncbi:MAG TPA: RDD family protein [Bryobacteraceae bacterium]